MLHFLPGVRDIGWGRFTMTRNGRIGQAQHIDQFVPLQFVTEDTDGRGCYREVRAVGLKHLQGKLPLLGCEIDLVIIVEPGEFARQLVGKSKQRDRCEKQQQQPRVWGYSPDRV